METNIEDKKISFQRQIYLTFWILNFLRKLNPVAFPVAFFLQFVTVVFTPINNLLYAYLVDTVISSISNGNFSIDKFVNYVTLYLLFYIFTFVIRFGVKLSNTHLVFKQHFLVELAMSKHILNLGIEASEDPKFSNTISRVYRELYWIDRVSDTVFSVIFSFVQFVIYGMIVASFSPIVVFVYLIISIIYIIPIRRIQKTIYKFDYETTEERRQAINALGIIKNQITLPEILILGLQDFLTKLYKNTSIDKYAKRRINLDLKYYLWFKLNNLIRTALNILFLFFIVMAAVNGQITPGFILFYYNNLSDLQNSLDDFFEYYMSLYEKYIRFEEVVTFFNKTTSIKNGHIFLPRLKNGPRVELINISFKYPNTDKYIFKDFSLTINSCEKVAIVGKNGSGKTTLLKLISRFYDVNEGCILIDGIDIKDIQINEFYKNLGYLLQEFNLFDFLSVKYNVAIGKIYKEVDEQKITEALQNADAFDFVSKYPNGLDQLMNNVYTNGIKPSTGQAQKIAIARFFYRNSPLVIFDEPTSSIDAVSEAKIFENIYKFFENKTVIIVSHRFSTVKKADRIIVLDEGEIVEQGTHSELMKLNGLYAHSYTLQTESKK